MAAKASHKWKFHRAGGVDQVVLRDGKDIAELHTLDQKLWLALACPTKGIDIDERTLAILDSDNDGRIRVPEVLSAIAWLKAVLRDMNALLPGDAALPLAAIADHTEAGKGILGGAKRILMNLGKADADSVTLEDVTDTAKIFATTRFNGDGVIPAEAADDQAIRSILEDVMTVFASTPDRSGKPGVDQKIIDEFFKDAAALVSWQARAKTDRAILVIGDQTAAAAAAVAAVRIKVDDFFARCRLASFDGRAATKMNREESEFATLALEDLRIDSAEIARLPLARVEAGRALPLDATVNPAWCDAILEFRERAVSPLLGADRHPLAEVEWKTIKDKLVAFELWLQSKPVTPVEKLELTRLEAMLRPGVKAAIDDLIAQDRVLEAENAQIAAVERLVRLYRDLARLLNNFVNFSDFYGRKGAVFQMGTLYLDGRSCDLCVRVDDSARHAAMAALAKSCLVYCDCVRSVSGEKMSIVAAFTNGDSDHLMVGRNGLFYDRRGRDFDATVTKVIDNPISIRQAFWSPYKRFLRMLEEQVAKRAGAADAEATKNVESAATALATADKSDKEPTPPKPKKVDVGTVAALGVAIAGIGAFLSTILAMFFDLGKWIPLGIVGLVLAISLPAMLIAWLKLRQRNLGPLLDANGWAINGRVKINVPFGTVLTGIAALPAGATRTLVDPYAEKRRWFPVTLAIILLLAGTWYSGKFDDRLPRAIRSEKVLGHWSWVALTRD